MSESNNNMPTPHPSLKALDKFIGTWSMKGTMPDSGQEIMHGEASFEWLPGGFFLQQHTKMNFMGMDLESIELVGYDPESDSLKSSVYSSMSPMPLPYSWKVDGDNVEITVKYGPLDATLNAKFDQDGQSYQGGWRPNPGADETVNVPYDITGKRVK